ncbi:MAG: DUF2339 domain-containing protein [Deltaproteobacteria bacterium]|nr:DUF2339 domain-containing protein [Deltaproteobacteria bacterium]
MDGAIVLIVMMAILLLAGIPIAALVLAIAAKGKARQNAERLALIEKKIEKIFEKISSPVQMPEKSPEPQTAAEPRSVKLAAPETIVTSTIPVEHSSSLKVDVQPDLSSSPAYRTVDTLEEAEAHAEATDIVSGQEAAVDSADAVAQPDTEDSSEVEVASPESAPIAAQAEQPLASAKPIDTNAPAGDTPTPPPRSLEEQIGLVWFTRIGAVIGILVAGWFFKYVVDNDIIGPWGRVAIGAIVGLGALITGELLFKGGKTNRIFNQGMQGLGLALMLISTYASSGFYHLVPVPAAFGATAILCLLGGALAIRHQSEGVLIFSLVAALMNPVMLSTGTDRPLALFTYLAVITVLTLFFSVRHNFRIAIWIAVSGVIVLFMGWYSRYFDIHSETIINDIKYNAGAYATLTARIIPLSAVSLFPVIWAVAGIRMNRVGHKQSSLALFLGAGVALTGGLTALLHDHYIILAGSLLGVSAAYSALLIRMGFGKFLSVPMITSFLTLLALSQNMDESDILWMLLIGGALAILFLGMVIREMVAKRTQISIPSLFVLCGSGVLFVIMASIMLLPDSYVSFGIIVVAASMLYLFFSAFMANRIMLFGAAVFSGILLLSQSDADYAVNDGFIYVACAWFLVYVLAAAYDLLVKNSNWAKSSFALLTGTGAAFLSLILANTQPEHNTLRALLCIGAGIVYLVIGTRLIRQKNQHNDLTLLPLGTALGFFGIATGLLLSGVTMTVAFAMEAVCLAYLASKSKRNDKSGNVYWFIGALAFGCVALVHMLGTDLDWLNQQRQLLLHSYGAEGTAYTMPLLNPFALSRIAIAAFLFLTAFFFRRIDSFTAAVKTVVILGHVLVVWLLTTEIQMILAKTVVFEPGLTQDEFRIVWSKMITLRNSESTQRGMIVTSVMGVYALGLIGAGFAFRDVMHRILGIALFGLTLLKLGLWDIWNFDTIYRIAVGATMTVALMTGGFLYARFKDRLKGIVSSQATDKLTLLAIIIVSGAVSMTATTAHGADLSQYEQRCPLKGPIKKGDHAIEITPSLYGLSKVQGRLSDFRITGPDNSEVPFTVRRETSFQRTNNTYREGVILNPVALADGASSAIVDFGESAFRHDSVVLTLSGQNFMRQTTIESSIDGIDYGVLSKGQLVYAVLENGSLYSRTILQYPVTNARYLRITVDTGRDNQSIRINGAKAGIRSATSEEQMLYRNISLSVSRPQKDADGRTIVMLGKTPPNVPLSSVTFKIANDEFVRRVAIQASTHRESWFTIGGGVIYKIQNPAGEPADTARTKIEIEPTAHTFLRAVFQDHDDAPLALTSAQATYPVEKIVFRAKNSGSHVLYVGNADANAPQYDLSAVLQRSDQTVFNPVSLGECRKNNLSPPKDAEPKLPWTEQYALLLKILMGIVLVGLIVWTIRTLKTAGKS